MTKHAPPPTKFGPRPAAQPKSALQPARAPFAPPARMTPGFPAQAKTAQPVAHAPVHAFPGKPVTPVQPKMAVPVVTHHPAKQPSPITAPPVSPPSAAGQPAAIQPMLRFLSRGRSNLAPRFRPLYFRRTYLTDLRNREKMTEVFAHKLAGRLGEEVGDLYESPPASSVRKDQSFTVVAEHSDFFKNGKYDYLVKHLKLKPLRAFAGVTIYSCMSTELAKKLSIDLPGIYIAGVDSALSFNDKTGATFTAVKDGVLGKPITKEAGLKTVQVYKDGNPVFNYPLALLRPYEV